ncbi:MAG: DUF1572 family protein [Ferruginibacter sp.]
MIIENMNELFTGDLKKLRQEMEAYEDEFLIWEIKDGINNSAGNLCLHLIGNLNNYIGAILGNTGYVRNRDLEFSLKNVPKVLLMEDIDKVIIVIKETFSKLTDELLNENYPSEVLGFPMTKLYFLMHLLAHLNYHLGQINYHRRIITNIRK